MTKFDQKALRTQVDALAPPFSPDQLEMIRDSFGLNIAEFARLLRIDRSTWHNWEKGRTAMPAIAHTAVAMLLLMRKHNKSLALMDWIGGC